MSPARTLEGPSFPLKQVIDEGVVSGPRIYPCGAMITTTGGHCDLRPLQDIPRSSGGPLSPMEESGGAMIADSADEVRLRVRRAASAGRFPDQARRKRRRVVAAHFARHDDVQRIRVSFWGASRLAETSGCGN